MRTLTPVEEPAVRTITPIEETQVPPARTLTAVEVPQEQAEPVAEIPSPAPRPQASSSEPPVSTEYVPAIENRDNLDPKLQALEDRSALMIKEWDQYTPEEKELYREKQTQAMGQSMKGAPAAGVLKSVMGKAASAGASTILDLTQGKDREPAFFELVQEANARGLGHGDNLKQQFFGETLPQIPIDSPLYAASAILTKGFGTFTTMDLLDQALDKINTGEEFDSTDVKTALLTDALFKVMPSLGIGAKLSGGATQRVATEAGKVALNSGIFTGTGAANQYAKGEDIDLDSLGKSYLQNALMVSFIHMPQLVNAAQVGRVRTFAKKQGLTPESADAFANELAAGNHKKAMVAVADTFQGDKSKIKQFLDAVRKQYNPEAATEAAPVEQMLFNAPKVERPAGVPPATAEQPTQPKAADILLSRTKTAGVRTGADAPVFGTKGQSFPAKYAVIPRTDIVSSHDPLSFSKNPAYPLANTRDYSNKAEQEKVLAVRNSFEAARHITDSPDAAVGPSMVARIIDKQGKATLTVLGGNNREMAISQLTPEKQQALQDYTNARLDRFGVDALQGDDTLVRFMGEFDLRKAGERDRVQAVVDSLNPSPGKVQNVAEMARVDAGESIPLEQLVNVPAEISTGDAQSFINAAIGAGALDRNLRSQIAENPQQAVEYVKRLQVHGATGSNLLTDTAAGNNRRAVAVRGMIDAATPALITMRQKGAVELADTFTRSLETVVTDFNKIGKLPAALDKAAGQTDFDPQYKMVNTIAASMRDAVVTNKRGAIDTDATIDNFMMMWGRIRDAMQQYTGEADMFGESRTPEQMLQELVGGQPISTAGNSPATVDQPSLPTDAELLANGDLVAAFLKARGGQVNGRQDITRSMVEQHLAAARQWAEVTGKFELPEEDISDQLIDAGGLLSLDEVTKNFEKQFENKPDSPFSAAKKVSPAETTPPSTTPEPSADQPYAIRLTPAGKKRIGKVNDWQQVKLGGMEFVRPLEMPELLKLARMMNVDPQLVKHRGGTRGMMKSINGVPQSAQITLDRRLFKNPGEAAKTLAHEIGHLIDFLPNGTLKRGNLIGRLESINGFRKNVLGTMNNKELVKELYELSKWWRPFDEAAAPDWFVKYRKSSVELYADSISVLFNAPNELQKRAPTWWKHFFDKLENKPQVKENVLLMWDQLSRPESDLLRSRSADIHKMFGRGEEILLNKAKERKARWGSFKGFTDRVKQQYSDIYHPAVKAARKAKANGKKLAWDQDPEMLLDESPLAGGNVTYRIMDRIFKKVVQPLEAEGFSLETLGEYLFLNRVLNEGATRKGEGRSAVGNPLGMEPKQARAGLLYLRLSLGMETMTALEHHATFFQDAIFETVEDAVKAGTYNAEFVEKDLKPNKRNYVTFAVLDHLEHNDKIPAGIKKQLGTLKDIANPFTATLIKTIALARWNQYNKAKTATINLLGETFDEAVRAPVKKAGSRIIPNPPPNGQQLTMVMRDGKPEWWYVAPEINAMFESQTPATNDIVLQVLNWGFRNVIYPMWITYNPAFNMFMNPVRDFRRTQRNLPIKGNVKSTAKLLKEYANSYKSARRRLLNETDPLIAEMMDNFAIGSPFDSFTSNIYREDAFGKMLQQFRMMPETEAAAWKRSKVIKPVTKLLKQIEFYGQVFESLPKVASYKILTKDLGMEPRDAAHYVRNVLGTPNYMKKGKHISVAGNIIPFANIFLQGWKSDLHTAFKNPKTRGGWWYKWASTNGMSTMLKAMAASGLLGVALKELFDGVGEYDKTNYDIIPLGSVTGGMYGSKTAYMRLPKDETSRFLDGVMYKALMGIMSDEEGSKNWNEAFAIGAGQFPGVHPMFTLRDGWSQYLSGQNPIDTFRNSPVLSNDQWLEGGWEGTKGMINWSGQQIGLNNFFRYNKETDSTIESVLYSTPVINKVIKISDYGHREKQQQEEQVTDKERAIVRNDMSPAVATIRREYYMLRTIKSNLRTEQQQERYQDLHYWYRNEFSPAWEEILTALESDDIKRAKEIAKQIPGE